MSIPQIVRSIWRKDQSLPNSDEIGLTSLNFMFLCGLYKATIRKVYGNYRVIVNIHIEEIPRE
jgi:hypothetical protein